MVTAEALIAGMLCAGTANTLLVKFAYETVATGSVAGPGAPVLGDCSRFVRPFPVKTSLVPPLPALSPMVFAGAWDLLIDTFIYPKPSMRVRTRYR